MNRDIKFRVWNIVNKRILDYADIMALPMWEVFPGTPEQRAYEVMQYTGLKDKNGKEIYEGDYIKAIRNHSGYKCEIKGIVKYECGSFYVEVKYPLQMEKVPMFELSEIFKLGNIYENPELLGN